MNHIHSFDNFSNKKSENKTNIEEGIFTSFAKGVGKLAGKTSNLLSGNYDKRNVSDNDLAKQIIKYLDSDKVRTDYNRTGQHSPYDVNAVTGDPRHGEPSAFTFIGYIFGTSSNVTESLLESNKLKDGTELVVGKEYIYTNKKGQQRVVTLLSMDGIDTRLGSDKVAGTKDDIKLDKKLPEGTLQVVYKNKDGKYLDNQILGCTIENLSSMEKNTEDTEEKDTKDKTEEMEGGDFSKTEYFGRKYQVFAYKHGDFKTNKNIEYTVTLKKQKGPATVPLTKQEVTYGGLGSGINLGGHLAKNRKYTQTMEPFNDSEKLNISQSLAKKIYDKCLEINKSRTKTNRGDARGGRNS